MILLFSTSISASVHLAPAIRDSPDDLIYEVGTTNNTLVWVFEAQESADAPSKYSATLDGAPIENHTLASWSDLNEVSVNVDGLALGRYVVTITVNDTGTDALQAASATDTVNVHVVVDTAAPLPSASSSTSTVATTTSTSSSTTENPVSSALDRISEGKDSSKSSDTSDDATLPLPVMSVITGIFALSVILTRRRN